jgi:TolB-like protein
MNSVTKPELIDLSREPAFRLGAVEFRPATREVVIGETCEMLEPRVMQVLVTFSRRRGEVVSRDELVLSCWAGRVVSDDAINRCISRVRGVAEAFGGFTLETVPRVGYRLTEIDPAPPSTEVLPPPAQQPARLDRRWLFAAVAAALFGIIAAGAYWMLRPASPAANKITIAVLPFTPAPGSRDDEQLGDRLAAQIAEALVREGIDVVSPAKSRLYRGESKAQAAQALKADFVIDGEVLREDGMIRVPMRAVEGASGITLVADTVAVPAAEATTLPDLTAVSALSWGWGWLTSADPAARQDLRVVAGSLKVVKHLTNPSETVYAYNTAKQIAAAAPDDAFAQYLLAMSAAIFLPDLAADRRPPFVAETRAAAENVLRLDPEFGDAYAAIAKVTPLFYWSVRENLFRKGLRVRPSSPLTYMNMLALRMDAGYLRRGGYQAEEAFSNHSQYDLPIMAAINARLWQGDPAAARLLIARAMKRYPSRANFPAKMFEATAFYGALDDADALLKSPAAAPLLQPQGEGRTYGMILAALRHHRSADIAAVATDCAKVPLHTSEFQRTCFMALVKLGRLDEAFRMADSLYPDQRGATKADIERRWLAHMPFETAYLFVPVTAPLRADPRFPAVAERLGLLQFWKERGTAPDFCAVEKVDLCAGLKH